jgi:predicted nucleic acid-binding protein
MAIYVDTSALVKRYLPERASQRWERFVIPHATRLIRELGVPLATLDAIHLACAQSYGYERVATGDRQFARAVERCRLAVHEFSE